MNTQFFQRLEAASMDRSLNSVKNERYLLSWVQSLETRAVFVLELVSQAALLPFKALELTLGSFKAFYTWGGRIALWESSKSNLNQTIHRIFFSFIGAFFSPYYGIRWKDEDLYAKLKSIFAMILPNRLILGMKGPSLSWVVPLSSKKNHIKE